VRGDVQEPHLAEAVPRDEPVAAADGQADAPGRNALEIHRRVVHVRGVGRRLGELDVSQCNPLSAVGRVFDRDVLETEAEQQLELRIVVPDQHLMELVDAIEVVLNPHRLIGAGAGQPHVTRVHGVLVLGVHAGGVSRVLRSGVGVRVRGSGHDVLDGIGEGLRHETPDPAFEYGVVGSGADAVDAPVIGLVQREQTLGIERGSGLPLTDQHTSRISGAGATHVVPARAQIDVVPDGGGVGPPRQHRVTRDIQCPVRGAGVGRLPQVGARDHGLNLSLRHRAVVDADIVHQSGEVLAAAGPRADSHLVDRPDVSIRAVDEPAVQEPTARAGFVGAGHMVPFRVDRREDPLVAADVGDVVALVVHFHVIIGALDASVRDEAEDARLVGYGRRAGLDPRHDRSVGGRADSHAPDVHVVVFAVEQQRAVDASDHPLRTAPERAVVAPPTGVVGDRSRALVERPPSDQRGIGCDADRGQD